LELFSYISIEERVAERHRLRLIRALLLQAFYSIRSERQLMEQMAFNLLYRWFVELGPDERVWDASTFSKNRDWLFEADGGHRV
jgi:transposase